jgi:hypothetical protein
MIHRGVLGSVLLVGVMVLGLKFVGAQESSEVKLSEIAIFYHGLALDKDRHALNISEQNLPILYRELANQAVAAAPESPFTVALRGAQILQSNSKENGENAVAKFDFIVDTLVTENAGKPEFSGDIYRNLGILRSFVGERNVAEFSWEQAENVQKYIPAYKTRNQLGTAETYKKCEDPTVPKPPAYGSTDWNEHITLMPNESFLQQLPENTNREYPPTEIAFYRPKSEPKGLCALLKRYKIRNIKTNDLNIDVVGAICESETSGKSCFWGNQLYSANNPDMTDEGTLEKYSDIQGSWASSASGKTNPECTNCHGGNNAFVFYKGTDLCYNDKFRSIGYVEENLPCFGDEAKAHMSNPIGMAGYVEKFNAPLKGVSNDNKCLSCHDLVHSNSKYYSCEMIGFVTGRFMPPNGSKEGLHWEYTENDPANPYYNSIMELKNFCNPPPDLSTGN